MDSTCPLESAVHSKGSHLGKAPIPSLLAAKAFLVRAGGIRFCLSGHRLAEGQDTNVPAVIQRKLSLAVFRSLKGCGSKRPLSYSIMIIIM